MKLIMQSIALAVLITGCATTRQARVNQFKEITKDMQIQSKEETRIAQILYLKMVNKRNYER